MPAARPVPVSKPEPAPIAAPTPSPAAAVLASAQAAAIQPAEPVQPVVAPVVPDDEPEPADLSEPVTDEPEIVTEPDPEPEVTPDEIAAPDEAPDLPEEVEPEPESLAPPIANEAPELSVSAQMGASAAAVEAAVDRLSAGGEAGEDTPQVDIAEEPAAKNGGSAASRFTSRMSALVPKFGAGRKDKAEPVIVPEPEPTPDDDGPGDDTPSDATAMSAEREVDLDTEDTTDEHGDPQTAIDHAIEVLDRAASGEGVLADKTVEIADPAEDDIDFERAEAEDEGGGSPALTIFLVLVLLLLAGAGGASYWAWREGYLDLSNLFGSDPAIVSEVTTPVLETPTANNEPADVRAVGTDSGTDQPGRPGNTAATPNVVETPATGLEQSTGTTGSDDVLALAPTNTAPSSTPTATMDAGDADAGADSTVAASDDAASAAAGVAEPSASDDKIDERLPVAEDTAAAPVENEDVAAVSPEVVTEGSQSLLLEASDEANAGAVPFSGTVEWTRGVDELGVPTLEARVDIPARNMGVNLLIRKNSDQSLPASHLIEIDFDVSDSFIGGGISRVAGILLKNEELVQGVPLVGASARVVGNSFLFALSAASEDVATNTRLLESRKWMDLAIIYSTGKQAILTLEKDAAATALFDEVIDVWSPDATTDG